VKLEDSLSLRNYGHQAARAKLGGAVPSVVKLCPAW